MSNSKYFFAYDHNVAHFLRYEKNIEFITKARHLHTHQIFYMFYRTPELENAIEEYHNMK